jgi:glycerol-3-phosphate O-acyltransferase/dihydroxyacetone phosphate acyltransferase
VNDPARLAERTRLRFRPFSPVRRALDRIVGGIASLAVRGYFRSVEVRGEQRIPHGRPVLIVANHFNGLVDPVVIAHVLHRVPRFLAKSTLWKVLPARPFLALAGVIPIYRSQDVTDTSRNRSSFTACHRALARHGTVAIFPEGTTHDSPALAPVRTGAARIALGALAAGTRGIVIVPIGLTFDDKLALRSRVLARVGRPIDLDEDLADYVHEGEDVAEENYEAVDRLTVAIRRRLRDVSPDYRSVQEHGTLSLGADVALRRTGTGRESQVKLGAREELAQRLAEVPDGRREKVIDSVADYNLGLTLLGVRDGEVAAGYRPRALLTQLVVNGLVVAVLSVFAFTGVVVNIIPYLLVKVAGQSVRAPVTKGTVRLLVALIGFPLAWWIVAMFSADGAGAVTLAFLFQAMCAFAAVYALEALIRFARQFTGWWTLLERRGVVESVRARREQVVRLIDDTAVIG